MIDAYHAPTADIITFGETMAVLRAHEPGPLQHNDALRLSCAGAESTVAIGAARLGHHVVWIGRTGDDELGELVRSTLRSAGVSVRDPVDPHRPTGLLVRKPRTASVTRVHYYRRGSAGGALCVDDLRTAFDDAPRIVHATGITAALSETAGTATTWALRRARDHEAVVSFDVNLRTRLTDVATAAKALGELLPLIDVLFCGEDELPVLATALGHPVHTPPDRLAVDLAGDLVVKRGRHGAVGFSGGERVDTPAVSVHAVDVVGAGDAFVAGYLSGLLDALPFGERLHRGACLGAAGVATHGDWEGLPTRADLALIDTDRDFTDR